METRHIITTSQFSIGRLEYLFSLAEPFKELLESRKAIAPALEGLISANLCFDRSTRTRLCFDSAMKRLGGSVVTLSLGREEAASGEALADTVRTAAVVSGADVIILRCSQVGEIEIVAKKSPVPIISAGVYGEHHPMQALAAMFTVQQNLGTINGLHFAIAGDIKKDPTIRSIINLLGNFPGVKITFSSPELAGLQDEDREYLDQRAIRFIEEPDFEKAVGRVDVLFHSLIPDSRRILFTAERRDPEDNPWAITEKVLGLMKEKSIILTSRILQGQIAPKVDDNPRALYHKEQLKNELCMAMALLKMVLLETPYPRT